MVSSEIVEYVREQLRAGYSPEEIRDALEEAGWDPREIEDAFSLAQFGFPVSEPPQPSLKAPGGTIPPVEIRSKSHVPLALSLLGGLLIFILGLEVLLALPLVSQLAGPLQLAGLMETFLSGLVKGVVLLIYGLAAVAGALLSGREGRERAGGAVVLVFSLLVLAGFHGALALAGGILGVLGGVWSLRSG